MAPGSPSKQTHSMILRVADLAKTKPTRFAVQPNSAQLATLVDTNGLLELRDPTLTGKIEPIGKADWKLTAELQATAIQPCVTTLEPVKTDVNETVERLYVAQWHTPEGSEVEMPEDTDAEPLPTEIDLQDVLAEALSLSLPLYPRAQNAELGAHQFTEPGKKAMSDADARPFAALAKLKFSDGDTSK